MEHIHSDFRPYLIVINDLITLFLNDENFL